MDRDNQKVMADFETRQIGIDDTFRFHCTMCGRCCIDREDILLNPYDLYRLARAKDMEPDAVLKEYCEAYLGPVSRMVMVRLMPIGSEKRCPLLEGAKCSVHDMKPTVCALFPLGRGLKMNKEAGTDVSKAELQYFIQDVHCGDQSETHTVREWLGEFGLDTGDTFFARWSKTVLDYGSMVRQVEDKVSAATANMLCAAILGNIYLNYDMTEPFLPQYERNDSTFRQMLARINILPEQLKENE